MSNKVFISFIWSQIVHVENNFENVLWQFGIPFLASYYMSNNTQQIVDVYR